MADLAPFEGRDVLQCSIKVTNAGDGLSTALNVEPVEYHQADTVYVLLETEVARVSYEPIKDTETLRRVHTLRAGIGTVVDATFALEAIAEQKRKNLAAAGVVELPYEDEDGDA